MHLSSRSSSNDTSRPPERAWHLWLVAAVLLACGSSAADIQAQEAAAPEGSAAEAQAPEAEPPAAPADPGEVTAPIGAGEALPEMMAGERGWFGVQLEPLELADAQALGYDRELVRVRGVFPGTPAETAGVQTGDLVLTFNGQTVPSVEQLVEWVGATPPATQVTFVLLRGGEQIEQPVLLGIRPELEELVISMFRDKPAPAVSANRLTDDTPFVIEAGAGITVIDFWATWCGPCLRAMPMLGDMQRRFADQGVTFVGISSEEPAVLRGFAAENEVGYTLAYDVESQTTENYYVTAYPTLFVIDATGTVTDVFIGGDEIATLEQRLQELVAR